jgi:hypothetical protein
MCIPAHRHLKRPIIHLGIHSPCMILIRAKLFALSCHAKPKSHDYKTETGNSSRVCSSHCCDIRSMPLACTSLATCNRSRTIDNRVSRVLFRTVSLVLHLCQKSAVYCITHAIRCCCSRLCCLCRRYCCRTANVCVCGAGIGGRVCGLGCLGWRKGGRATNHGICCSIIELQLAILLCNDGDEIQQERAYTNLLLLLLRPATRERNRVRTGRIERYIMNLKENTPVHTRLQLCEVVNCIRYPGLTTS